MDNFTDSVVERMKSNVAKTDNPNECWTWQKAKTRAGYGVLGTGRHKLLYAHRVAYEMAYGPIPPGYSICHHCDNPACCNPRHLFAATQQENIKDMNNKGRGSQPPITLGKSNINAKLTDDAVRKIRQLRQDGASYNQLAKMFNVGWWTIGRVVRNESWEHVE